MPKSQPTPTIDLRPITRDPHLCRPSFTLHWDWETESTWIMAGQCQLRTDRKPDSISLDARMDGATDREHDAAYAFQLPIIGHRFEDVLYHVTTLTAWISPNALSNFHVPASTFKPKGYDLRNHPESYNCESCKGDDAHIIVPYFVPPVDAELYKLVRGKRVTIRIGPPHEE